MTQTNTPQHIKLDERNHVEKPLLDQLTGLGWEIIDLDNKQHPADSHRNTFTEVVMLPVLREQLKVINPWLEDDQTEEVVKQLTASFPGTGLIGNNRYVLNLLLENTSISENRKTGEKSPTVHFIDFNHRENNRFIAVCQFKVRILGTEHHIIPDIVLFVNGLPVVVIECKSPKVKEPMVEAIDQMLRYSEQRGAKGEGSAPLFYYNQFVVGTCRQEAKFGTITTHSERLFFRWADPYPRTVKDLEHGAGGPNDQQRLVAGMLDRDNLLDLIRTFTLFSTNDKGETIKIVGRYQQFRAVKLGVQRLLEGRNPRERSGIIWHTQGSGKSLTMMFMVREMYRHSTLSKWKVVFITDRTQLEQQLSETSQSIGFSVKMADSIRTLKELLRSDSSDLVMAMIHKFREADLKQTFPELNSSPHILVMTDEAHRSQYAMLGANLDKAIPNAARIGYTGTPIDKTERVFGDYIDKYTMRQSIEDGVTLEIVYEGRTHNAEVADQTGMDTAFADVFSEYNLKDRLEILGYGSRDAYLEAKSTIKAKAGDMVEHYLTHVFPNGYKAQVVAVSREAAVRYKTYIDKALAAAIAALENDNPNRIDIDNLKKLRTDVIISGGHNDLPHLKAYADKSTHDRSIKSFKLPFDGKDEGITGDMGIVIVRDMLLTGFDAPVEQVMYLDKVIVAHNLLQAIARVNRVGGEGKDKGFVVDYVGIGHHLKKAIDISDEREQKDVLDALSFPEKELNDLRDVHRTIMAFFEKHGLTDLNDHDAFFDLFYDEDLRFEYLLAFKKFTKSLNLVFPAKEALDFMPDYQQLSEINVLAGKHFRDARLSMKGIPPKLRGLTDAYLASKGIVLKVAPISILDQDFESQVDKRKRTKTKAAEVEHAIRHHLDVDLDDDPDLQASFAEALKKILEDFQKNWRKIYEELEKLRKRIINSRKEPTYGLHRKKQMPLFRMFRREIFGDEDLFSSSPYEFAETQTSYGMAEEDRISHLVDLTQKTYLVMERELKLPASGRAARPAISLERTFRGFCWHPSLPDFPIYLKTVLISFPGLWRLRKRTTTPSCTRSDMDLDYTIVRSHRRRKLTITVERDRSVVVHAPESISKEKIHEVVEAKRQWIFEKMHHPQKYRDLPHPPGKELVNGESALYLGRHYRIEVVKTGLSEIRFNQRFYIPAAHAGKRQEVLREWYIQRAEEKIIPRVKHHAHTLGVSYSKAKIVDNLYRWGSCTVNNNVNLNWRLIKAPMFVIDYAIVHELTHLIEANHTPGFWNIIRAQAPTMEKAKAWLKDNGQLLEQAI